MGWRWFVGAVLLGAVLGGGIRVATNEPCGPRDADVHVPGAAVPVERDRL